MDMNMIQFHEKVYVVLGYEIQEEEGFLTLNWVINKWASYHHPFSIVILFINSSSSSPLEFVDTPFGKLPASSVSEDMLQTWRKCEQDKIEKLFNKYIAFCGKVKAEIQSIINKQDEPIQKTVVDLIIEKRITKLVMGMTFMRSSSSGRSKNAISGSFYIHKTKPDFCELFIISKGKLVFVKEENDNEGYIEDEEGKIVAKLKKKGSLRDWLLEKMLPNNVQVKSPTYPSPKSSCMECDSPFSRNSNDWEFYEQDVEEYFKELVDSMKEKKESVQEYASSSCMDNSPSHQNILVDGIEELQISGDGVEDLKKKIQEARTLIESNKNAVEAEVDRQAKAQWAISLCNTRAEQLQAQIAEDISTRNELTKEIDNTKEQMNEILADVQENKNRLKSLIELQSELSSKLQISSLAKLGAETQLENATRARVELVREIEELRKQRDVFQRRIEFCKEKDAIGLATRMSEQVMSCSYREFNADEIRVATGNFSVYSRLACGGDCRSSVYKGRINRLSVAVQMLDSDAEMSQEIFQSKVNLLASTRHPHVTAFIGFCSELRCLVFEYMHNGCLRDILFSRTKARVLQWHQRIQIAAHISLGIQFLNLAEPRPILCNGLNPSTVYLDKNLVAKLNSFELTPCCDEADVQAEVNAFGDLLLQLLTGRNWARIDHEAMLTNKQVILEALDGNAGDWSSDLVDEIVHLAIKCRTLNSEPNVRAIMSSVTKTLNELKKKADVMTMREYRKDSEDSICSGGEDWSHVPSNFLCPILQVIMDNPHIAADGHSYELEAIEEWLRMGHDTSPVTNQKLKHKHLVPNNNLRFLIQDWRKFVNLLKNMDSSGDGKSNLLELRPLSISHLCLL